MTRSARIAVRCLLLACGLSLLAGLLIEYKPHFAFEAWPGFYALFGFLAYCFIVLAAKQLRPWLHRPEDYYGEEPDPEAPADD